MYREKERPTDLMCVYRMWLKQQQKIGFFFECLNAFRNKFFIFLSCVFLYIWHERTLTHTNTTKAANSSTSYKKSGERAVRFVFDSYVCVRWVVVRIRAIVVEWVSVWLKFVCVCTVEICILYAFSLSLFLFDDFFCSLLNISTDKLISRRFFFAFFEFKKFNSNVRRCPVCARCVWTLHKSKTTWQQKKNYLQPRNTTEERENTKHFVSFINSLNDC